MKPINQPCDLRTPSDPVNAAFFWRSKADTLLKVDLEEVWSDQIPDVKVNKLPNNYPEVITDGGNERYLVISFRHNDNAHVKAKVSGIPNDPELRDKFIAQMRSEDEDSQSWFDMDWANEIASISYYEPPKMPFNLANSFGHLEPNAHAYKVYLQLGFDWDADGELLGDEILVDSKISGDDKKFYFRIVDQLHYNSIHEWAIGGALLNSFQFPIASSLLIAFMQEESFSTPSGSSFASNTSFSAGQLSHQVGVGFNSSGTGPAKEYAYSPTTELAEKILASATMSGKVKSLLDSKVQEIEQAFSDPSNANENTLFFTFAFETNQISFGGEGGDLFRAINTGGFSGSVSAEVTRSSLHVQSALVEATVTDTYDWRYNTEWRDSFAAQVQAGAGTLGTRGEPFKINVQILGLIPGFTHTLTPTN